MKILFWLRKSKTNTRGLAPIYCRITISGIRCKDFHTGLFVEPGKWNSKRQQSKDEIVNARLRQIHNRLDLIFIELENAGQVPDPELVKSIFQQKITLKPTFAQICEKHTAHIEHEVSIGRLQPRTLLRYRNFDTVIKSFLKLQGCVNLQADQFDIARARKFLAYCQDILGHGNDHSHRMVNNVRIVLQWTLQNGIIQNNPMFQWKGISDPPKEIVYLEPAQVQLIRETNFTRESLQKVADLFLFQCFTGLDYGDTQTFIPGEHIRQDPDGRHWIIKHRQKNGSKAALPLFTEALEILDRYQGEDLLGPVCYLPKYCNQKYNFRLKELASSIGLDVHLTSHVGRKTFGMIALNAGYSIEAVSAMLGHRFVATTQRHYAKVLEERVRMEWRGSLMG